MSKNGKNKKLAMSLLFQVFWNDDVSVVKNAVFPNFSSLSALTYNSLTDVQKFIPLRMFIVSVSANYHWKAKDLLYIFHVYAQT
jgi:hypothetical protein